MRPANEAGGDQPITWPFLPDSARIILCLLRSRRNKRRSACCVNHRWQTRKNTPHPAAGDSPTLRTANLAMRRCTQSASPATSPQKIATTFSLTTHLRAQFFAGSILDAAGCARHQHAELRRRYRHDKGGHRLYFFSLSPACQVQSGRSLTNRWRVVKTPGYP